MNNINKIKFVPEFRLSSELAYYILCYFTVLTPVPELLCFTKKLYTYIQKGLHWMLTAGVLSLTILAAYRIWYVPRRDDLSSAYISLHCKIGADLNFSLPLFYPLCTQLPIQQTFRYCTHNNSLQTFLQNHKLCIN